MHISLINSLADILANSDAYIGDALVWVQAVEISP